MHAKVFKIALLLAMSWLLVTSASAIPRGGRTLHGQSPYLTKADQDTVYLLGGPDRLDGSFQTTSGIPEWHGWTGLDRSLPPIPASGYWNISDFNAAGLNGHPAGNLAMWCGTTYGDDPGYGNYWQAPLLWSRESSNPGGALTVRVTAWLNHDTEDIYDIVSLQVWRTDAWETMVSYSGEGQNVAVDETVILQASDLSGGDVQLRWMVYSDSAISDEDGRLDTDGACQVDDITVSFNGEVMTSDTFEDGAPVSWEPLELFGVGDFAQLYSSLQDHDSCYSNFTPQVAFVDDGVVVPGTGGTFCVTWCYGPGGFIVNNNGGLAGPDYHLHSLVVSPPVALPAGLGGLHLAWDVYIHEYYDLNSPGTYHTWTMRSTDSGDPADLDHAPWVDSLNTVGLYPNGYQRLENEVGEHLVPDAQFMQLALGVREIGWLWGFEGTDGTPAPYFDNVAIAAHRLIGPHMSMKSSHLAQDNFPELGDLDFGDLSANHCRFDMAANISPAAHLRNDPGDSLVIQVKARDGAELSGEPRMIVAMRPNPLFEDVRILPPEFAMTPEGLIKGTVDGSIVVDANGSVVPNKFSFDLPDTGFFFPGDEIHYFFEAADLLQGDLGLTRLPVDTLGYHDFGNSSAMGTVFDQEFQVRALPTLLSATPGDQPLVLFWFDAEDEDELSRWLFALGHSGRLRGDGYDIYRTQAARSGVGNGLGARASSALLDGYQTLLYTCDDLASYTLSNGDFSQDPSPDLDVVSNWFSRGDRHAFLVGDNLLTSLLAAGADGAAFANTYIAANYIDESIQQYIGSQTAPEVQVLEGNGVVAFLDRWIAYGGCPRLRNLDALEPQVGASRLAEFTDPSGNVGSYSYSALQYRYNSGDNAEVVFMPTAFGAVRSTPGWTPPAGLAIPVRSYLFIDIMNFFGTGILPPPVGTPEAGRALTVSAYPNPFNPQTVIMAEMPRDGRLEVRVFDLRGALVRTLCDESRSAGAQELIWRGEDERGAQAASGVYFYEVKAAGETRMGKLTLVK